MRKTFILLIMAIFLNNGMAQETKNIVMPFSISVDPMQRLLLVNLEKDPDTLYIGFEPQVFDDAVHGKGHLVIGWRADGRVDVFHERGLKLDPATYDIAGKGLAHMEEREMRAAFFDINGAGVQAHYVFDDIHNREVVIRISESNSRKRKPFGLLAPMGDAAENPSAMPLVLLHDFYFVRKKHTEIEVSVDGRRHRMDNLPMPMDWARMTFIRYSPQPLIAKLNPAVEGELPSLTAETGAERIISGDHEYMLEWRNGMPYIKCIVRNNEIYPLELRFTDPFPDIASLAGKTSIKGGFEIEGHHSTGLISGHYTIEKDNDRVTVTMIPSGGWRPRPDKFSLRFMYTVAGVFKKWPTTYEWTADIREKDDGLLHMKSGWKRNRK